MATKKTETQSVQVASLARVTAKYFIVGESPLYFNSMGAKAMRDLLFPPKKKTAADRAATMKHNPRREFSDSVYRIPNQNAPTLLGFPASGFKGAMATAALATPGVKKTDVQRNLYVESDLISIYGQPHLKMDVVRSADMNRTPDVRTRAFMPEWCATLNISAVQDNFGRDDVTNLLANAGQVAGIGDFRQEKGRGNFGRWRLVSEDDADFQRLMTENDRVSQTLAMEAAHPWDDMTAELLAFHDESAEERGFAVAAE